MRIEYISYNGQQKEKSQNNQNNPQSTQRYQHNGQQFQNNLINDNSYQQALDGFIAVYGDYDISFY